MSYLALLPIYLSLLDEHARSLVNQYAIFAQGPNRLKSGS